MSASNDSRYPSVNPRSILGKDDGLEEWLQVQAEHLERLVAFSDSKAGLLLTTDAILIAALSGALSGDRPLIGSLSDSTRVLISVVFLAISAAVVIGLWTIVPAKKNLDRQDRDSLTNFASIKNFGDEQESYKVKLEQVSYSTVNRNYVDDIFAKSQFVAKKFRRLYYAILATGVAVAVAVMAVAVEVGQRLMQ